MKKKYIDSEEWVERLKEELSTCKDEKRKTYLKIMMGSIMCQPTIDIDIQHKTETEGENNVVEKRFSKVSLKQFINDWIDTFGNEPNHIITEIYNNIKLPKRATSGSAGYDFYAPIDIVLQPNCTIKIPTGIRVQMEENWVLQCYPRSGLGFKYRLQLNNTVGIIDSDYFYSDNEGHIFAKLTNDTNEKKIVKIKAGEGFMQGIFMEYGTTVDDNAIGIRNGGFGSTTI